MKSSRFITDYQEAAVRPSPDYDEWRGKGGISLLIMHYTGMECVKAAECHLETPENIFSPLCGA